MYIFVSYLHILLLVHLSNNEVIQLKQVLPHAYKVPFECDACWKQVLLLCIFSYYCFVAVLPLLTSANAVQRSSSGSDSTIVHFCIAFCIYFPMQRHTESGCVTERETVRVSMRKWWDIVIVAKWKTVTSIELNLSQTAAAAATNGWSKGRGRARRWSICECVLIRFSSS